MTQIVLDWMKANPEEARFIILMLLEDDVMTIADLVKLKEDAMRNTMKTKTEELSKSCALILRYKENINPKNLDADADNFLKNCSYTGLNLGKKE
jgi:hypothetical protein